MSVVQLFLIVGCILLAVPFVSVMILAFLRFLLGEKP